MQVGADTLREFEDQLATCTSTYVEESLVTHFSNLAGAYSMLPSKSCALLSCFGAAPPVLASIASVC